MNAQLTNLQWLESVRRVTFEHRHPQVESLKPTMHGRGEQWLAGDLRLIPGFA